MRLKLSWLPLLLLLSLCTPLVYAWNRAGHMVTGILAYKELKASNSKALVQIIAMLKAHPDYPKWQAQIQEQRLKRENAEMYLFAMAARWADDTRGTTFDQPAWHYVNLPVVPPQDAGTINPPQPAPENILKGFEENVAVLQSEASAADKAIAVCWLFHLVGDVHQPLHTTALFSAAYPKGDRGGNAIFIRVKPASPTINLHSFWDGVLIGSERFQSTTNAASKLRSAFSRRRLSELSETPFEHWALESFFIAARYAYRVLYAAPQRPINGGPDKDNGEALPRNYVASTKPVAERRAAVAGYRLADTLLAVATNTLSRAEPTTSPAPVPAKPSMPSGVIRGNQRSRIYHLPSCRDYEKVSEKNRVLFQTEAEARQAGYRKSGNCP
jgi:S1/P1 Nuclease